MTPEQIQRVLRRLEAVAELVAAYDDLDALCVPLSKIIEALETH